MRKCRIRGGSNGLFDQRLLEIEGMRGGRRCRVAELVMVERFAGREFLRGAKGWLDRKWAPSSLFGVVWPGRSLV